MRAPGLPNTPPLLPPREVLQVVPGGQQFRPPCSAGACVGGPSTKAWPGISPRCQSREWEPLVLVPPKDRESRGCPALSQDNLLMD